jgi:hypothetical protein
MRCGTNNSNVATTTLEEAQFDMYQGFRAAGTGFLSVHAFETGVSMIRARIWINIKRYTTMKIQENSQKKRYTTLYIYYIYQSLRHPFQMRTRIEIQYQPL